MPKLYLMNIAEADKFPEALAKELFPARTERAGRFLRKEDALRSRAAGALTACILGIREEEISVGEWGKPFLPDKKLFFNLSHSGDYAVLAVDNSPVGTDIEADAPVDRKVAEKVFTPEELLWMDEDPPTRFFELWTLKESVMKLDGRGFSLPPESFSVLPILKGYPLLCGLEAFCGQTTHFSGHTLSACAPHPFTELSPQVLTVPELLEQLYESSLIS